MIKRLLTTVAIITATAAPASAETIRWARAGDSITMDPHAQNEGPTHTLSHQIYDTLLQRDMAGSIIPSLATEWVALKDNPSIWRFKLRKGVVFHDGSKFNSTVGFFISLNKETNPAAGYVPPDVPMDTNKEHSIAKLCISSI